jgi:glutathione S-transferase
VLELYHNINSVCAQKVRIALNQKGQEAKDHILTLRGRPKRARVSQAQPERRRSDADP